MFSHDKSVISLLTMSLGFIMSSSSVLVDPKKVQAIVEWPISQNIHDVRSFFTTLIP